MEDKNTISFEPANGMDRLGEPDNKWKELHVEKVYADSIEGFSQSGNNGSDDDDYENPDSDAVIHY